MVEPSKLDAELRAAGIAVKAISGGGRVVIVDGARALVLEGDGRTWDEKTGQDTADTPATTLARSIRAAHDPAPLPPPPRRDELAALALVMRDGFDKAPAWALELVAGLIDAAARS